MVFVAYRPGAVVRSIVGAAIFILALPFVADSRASGREAPLDVAASGGDFTINEVLAKRDAVRPNVARQVAVAATPEIAIDAPRETMPLAHGNGTGPEPFGRYALSAPDGQLWTKWRAMEKDLAEEARAIEACAADSNNCADGTKRYLLIVEETRKREGRARLEIANRLLNRAIRYTADDRQHGVPDRWTAPLASLAAERGDCEDFALAKHAVLRAAGVSEADMRLVLVRDIEVRVDHAVLAVRFEGRWLVLDNRRAITVEAAELRDYLPLFAIDREGVKLFAGTYASWGEDNAIFAEWTLRGSDGASFGEWALRGSDVEPAAAD